MAQKIIIILNIETFKIYFNIFKAFGGLVSLSILSPRRLYLNGLIETDNMIYGLNIY